jgi:DNA-binding transcriptional regulator YdaS (Cro superfamily)
MTRHHQPELKALRARGIDALNLAIELAGSAHILAAMIGANPCSLTHWRQRDKRVPLDYVPAICSAVNHPKVTPYTLRPDLAHEWQRITPILVACAEGRGRTTPLDAFEVDSERPRNLATRTLKRIASELAHQTTA